MALQQSYLYGWGKPQKIAQSSPFIIAAFAKIVARYSAEGADKGRKYCVRDTGILGDSITDEPDPTNILVRWIGSNLPYTKKTEYLWKLGMPFSKNKNPNAKAHPLAVGINDVKDKFKDACLKGMRGEWEKI